MKKTKIDKQLNFWKKYGLLSPLVFAVGFIVCYWLDWWNIDSWMKIAGVVLACTGVCWWWWTMFTIGKLNHTLTRNVEQFLELLNIVKDLNHAVKEASPNNRKRGKPSKPKSKQIKE